MRDYSRTIYPIFLWYAYSAQLGSESVLPLVDFKNTVRLGFLELERNGADTLAWLCRNVTRKVTRLENENPRMAERIASFAEELRAKGVTEENTYLFMHGHTLMDNVVMVLLNTVCDKLRSMSVAKINASNKQGLSLRNEMSNYMNSLRSIRDVLLDNENYTTCPLYTNLKADIQNYIDRTVERMKRERDNVKIVNK